MQFNKLSGIRTKLIMVHWFLLILLISGLSIRQYFSQWDIAKQQAITYQKNLSQGFIGPLSLAMAGNNYSNVMLPVFNQVLKNTTTLLYLEVKGISDNIKEPYRYAYLKEIGSGWREYYPSDYPHDISNKIKKLKSYLKKDNIDKVKVSFLLHRAKEEFLSYERSLKYSRLSETIRAELKFGEITGINTDKWMLSISLPTSNINGGRVDFIYDISHLNEMKSTIIKSISVEFFTALILSFPLVVLATRLIIQPIEDLTQFISSDLNNINPEQTPSLQNKDEIGRLARRFKTLLVKAKDQMKKVERLTIKDPMTDLYNRRYYTKNIQRELAQASRSNQVISFFYIDIDNFKNYNDNYGHNQGDIALVAVANQIKSSVHRTTDLCFRLGGEEFLVVVNTTTEQDAYDLAEKVRLRIEQASILHEFNEGLGVLTVSIGVCSVTADRKVVESEVLSYSDMALYQAKEAGRNRLAIYEWDD